jgi:hypothetical protein
LSTTSGDALGRLCDDRNATTIEHSFSCTVVRVQQKLRRLCSDNEEADMTTSGAGEVSQPRRWAIFTTILSGTMLAILDSRILNIFVVPIMGEFQTNLRTVEWVLTSYNLAFAAFLIGLGSLGDVAGRRRLYVLGQLVFVVGSSLAAVASGPWQLIAFRAMQGLGAAAVAPTALALMLDHFAEGERGAALGIWGAAAGLGGALGPTVGGLVAQTWGWRVQFLRMARREGRPARPGHRRPHDSHRFCGDPCLMAPVVARLPRLLVEPDRRSRDRSRHTRPDQGLCRVGG